METKTKKNESKQQVSPPQKQEKLFAIGENALNALITGIGSLKLDWFTINPLMTIITNNMKEVPVASPTDDNKADSVEKTETATG